ncbi:cysteine-tRNA ligase [Batrachochytrium salamandrivorans]|nr:cysteine-tRNA ligase [Batrachochytrium salamandrivorans]
MSSTTTAAEANYTEVEGKANITKWLKPSAPVAANRGKLMMRNSLTDQLEEFVPHDGNKVTWYTCGPTVYNVCHMGHARAYLTFDILRRIMVDYLHYDVYFHVNITDVDDKIILQARRNHLVKEYLQREKPTLDALQLLVSGAVQESQAKTQAKIGEMAAELASVDISKKRQTELTEVKKQTEHKLKALGDLARDAQAAGSVDALVLMANDVLGGLLDVSVAEGENEVEFDQEIFNAHARKYEESFMNDMDRLGVRRPDVLTRVTEYIDEIIAYCQVLQDKGLAYESNGSVYMDTKAFEQQGHTYRKLKPFMGQTSKEELEESEGSLCASAPSEKRNDRDFVLWKKSKAREPFWASPRWGRGRPGWHIECSVVASSVLGPKLDIHAGGEDLKFPHHDNELCQSEAYHSNSQWVNYFLHAGHLHIQGLKMGKSLKNFITIEQALEKSSAKTLRILFLTQRWDGPFTYSEESLLEGRGKERRFAEFLVAIKTIEREKQWLKKKWNAPTPQEVEFTQVLYAKRAEAHEAILQNFDTPKCLEAMFAIVDAFYKYKSSGVQVANLICLEAGRYITKMLNVFGVNSDGEESGEEGSSSSLNEALVDDIIDFRKDIKALALASSSKDTKLALLKACDNLRDVKLVEHGIDLRDGGDVAVWEMGNVAELKRRLAEQERIKQEQEAKARENKLLVLVKEAEKWEAIFALGDPLNRKQEEEEPPASGGAAEGEKEVVSAASKKRKQKETQKQADEWARLNKAATGAGLDAEAFVMATRGVAEAFRRGEAVVSVNPAPKKAEAAVVDLGNWFEVHQQRFNTNVERLRGKRFASVEEYYASF